MMKYKNGERKRKRERQKRETRGNEIMKYRKRETRRQGRYNRERYKVMKY